MDQRCGEPLEVLEATGLHHVSPGGGSRSLVLRCEDGRLVLVKLKANPQSTRALVGDLVGTRLGLRAGAAFAPVVLVRVPFARVADIPPLRRQPWQPGLQFGTAFHLEAVPLDADRHGASLANLGQLAVTALVELWLHNNDFKPSHLLSVAGPRGPEFRVVDHGHILPGGPSWTPARLAGDVDRVVFDQVRPLTALARRVGLGFDRACVSACESIDARHLASLVAEVPPEWGLTPPRARALTGFLDRRRRWLPLWADHLARLWQD